MKIDLATAQIIDLTHSLDDRIPQWNDGCGFKQEIEFDYDESSTDVKFRIHKIEMAAGIGTHMDSPRHCFKEGIAVADIPLTKLITPCVMINASKNTSENTKISKQDILDFENLHGEIQKNSLVIIYTGWSKHWHTPEKYRNNLQFPSLSEDAAKLLLKRDIAGIAIDTLSPDRPDSHFIVHQLMLGAGKYIIENVANADKLPPTGSCALVMPLKIHDGTESPIRLVGLLS